MLRALKILGLIILALIILLAVAVFAVTRLIDPNDFKPEISAAAREQANLDLAIPGNLAWTFWPWLGIEVGRTEVRVADEEELFAAFDQVRTSIAVMPLLRGAVELSGLHLDGLELNLVETAEGANWERIGPQGETGSEVDRDESADDSALDIPLSIPELTLSNGRVRYVSSLDGSDIRIEQLNISADNVSLSKAFPLRASLRYQDQDDMRIDLAIDTEFAMQLESNVFRLNQLVVDATVAGATTLPLQIHARQSIEAALDEDRVSIRDILIEAAGTRTSGNLELTQLSGKPLFRGALSVAPFDANVALAAIGEAPIETSDPAALKKISMEMTFSGPENSILLDPLVIKLDSSTIKDLAGISDIDTSAIRFDLTLDQLVADGYLPPDEELTAEEAAVATTDSLLPPLSSEPLLPLEDLRELKVNGVFNIGMLRLEGIEARDLRLLMRADGGLLELVEANGQVMAGTLKSQASLDARSDNPVISFSAESKGLQIQPVMQMALEDDLFTGLLDMSMNFKASGNSEKALAESGVGSINMTLSKGTIRGMNLNNALAEGVNDMLGQYQVITQFLPQADQGRLPMALKEDTEVVELIANARVENLVAHVDKLNAELDSATLSGNGFLNLRSQAFDFHMGMKSPNISSNKYIADRTWPMRCKGNLVGNPAKWCGADSKAFRTMGKEISTQLAKDKLKDRFGADVEGDSAEEVIKNVVKDKAKDEAKKEAEKQLKKLFK